MKKVAFPMVLALAQMIAMTAFAQSSGEADPAQAKSPPAAKTTKAERSAARGERKTTGAEAARGPQMGEGQSEPEDAPKVSKSDRKAARAKRHADTSVAMKEGKLSRGGSSDAPEKVRKP